jgi:hypothetical protein
MSAAARAVSVWFWIVLGFIVLVLLLLIPAMRRRLDGAARLRTATAGDAWHEVLAVAEDLGVRAPPTLTPRETAHALAPIAGGEHLDRLRTAVERENFARDAGSGVDADDVREVTMRLHADATLGRRLLARFAPPSVWRRILRIFRLDR